MPRMARTALAAATGLAGRLPTVLAVLRRLAGDEGGNVLTIVALAAIPLMGAVGLAIDAGRAFIVQDQLQKALNAAGLAAGHAADQATAKADAQNFFNANFNAAAGAASKGLTVTFSSDGLTVTLTASATQPTTFMQVMGINTVTVSGQSVIKRQVTGLELALVLDNTGSMVDENKIGSLKTAAHELLDALYGTNDTIPNLWVSVVPFIAAVNVGTANAAFLKSGDQALGTASAFSPDKWGGCVLARYGSSGYDRTDDPPSVAKFSSYLYPKVTSGPSSAWVNNWGSGVSPQTKKYTAYSGGVAYYDGYGPNVGCPTAITPLTASKATVGAAIDAMMPWYRGGTIINEGLVWGWRSISPRWRGLWSGAPSTLPLDYNTKNMKKAIVLLTDGDNQMLVTTYNSTKISPYTAYVTYTNLGATTSSGTQSALDSRTTTVCNNIKAQGITIYTISLGSDPSASGKALLQGCASTTDDYFDAPDSATLSATFQTIGQQLSNLRIAQ